MLNAGDVVHKINFNFCIPKLNHDNHTLNMTLRYTSYFSQSIVGYQTEDTMFTISYLKLHVTFLKLHMKKTNKQTNKQTNKLVSKFKHENLTTHTIAQIPQY